MTAKVNRKQNVDYILLLDFKQFFAVLKKLSYVIKNPILLFFIFRKLKNKSYLKPKYSFKALFFFYKVPLNFEYNKLVFILFIRLFTRLNFLLFYESKIDKSSLQISSSNFCHKILNLFEDTSSRIKQVFIIKKEHLTIKLNDINFLILFDYLKNLVKQKKAWLVFLKYCKTNRNWLDNEFIFKKLFCLYIKYSFRYFDKFVFYLFQQINRVLVNQSFFCPYNCFHVFYKSKSLYIRYKDNFLIKTFTKNFYRQQFVQELLYFIKSKIKIKIKSLSFINMKLKNFYFLGYHLTFNLKLSNFLFKANLVKIIIRFFFLGYINKLSKPVGQFTEYLTLNQFLSLIKLKLILQSLSSYYKSVKNKKYIIFKTVLMLKITISKVFTSKFKYKYRAQILQFYKKDFSKFIFKTFDGMSRSLVYRICFGYRIS